MYAVIYSESLNNSGTGKASRVFADPQDLQFSIDEPSGRFVVQATYRDNVNSGDRGGEYNPVTRRLKVTFSTADLAALARLGQSSTSFKKARRAFLGVELDNVVHERDRAIEERDTAKQELRQLKQVIDDCTALLASTTPPVSRRRKRGAA
jgi:hypothetical protein